MIQQQDGSSFAYDAENRQIAFCPNDLPATCTQTAGNNRTLYYYDGTGKRVLSAGPGGTQTFVYDAWAIWRWSTVRSLPGVPLAITHRSPGVDAGGERSERVCGVPAGLYAGR